MNWKHETWRKLFVREVGSYAQLNFLARCIGAYFLKIVDDQGRFFVGKKTLFEALAFREGMSRGERRVVRPMLEALVADGYLVQRGEFYVLKNFAAAQRNYRDDEPVLDEVTTAPRTGHDGATTASPPCGDQGTTVSPPCDEPATTEQLAGNETEAKSAESLNTDQTVPSVPFLPSVPAVNGEGVARAHDPSATEQGDKPSSIPKGKSPKAITVIVETAPGEDSNVRTVDLTETLSRRVPLPPPGGDPTAVRVKIRPGPADPMEFAMWWGEAYPGRTDDKTGAWDMFWKLADRPPIDEMIATARWQRDRGCLRPGQFCKSPVKYLQEGKFNEKPPTADGKAKKSGLPSWSDSPYNPKNAVAAKP